MSGVQMDGKLFSLNGCMGGEFIDLLIDGAHMFVRADDIQKLIYDVKDRSVAIHVSTLNEFNPYKMGCKITDVYELIRAIGTLKQKCPTVMRLIQPAAEEEPVEKKVEVKLPRFNGKAFAEYLRLRNVICGAGYSDEYLERVKQWKYADAIDFYGDDNSRISTTTACDRFRDGFFNDREEFPDVLALHGALNPRGPNDHVANKWLIYLGDGAIYGWTKSELVAKLLLDGCDSIATAIKNTTSFMRQFPFE